MARGCGRSLGGGTRPTTGCRSSPPLSRAPTNWHSSNAGASQTELPPAREVPPDVSLDRSIV
eukprot:558119-Karenia_brevis.AAC.1